MSSIVTCRLKPHFASAFGRPREHLRCRVIDVDGILTLTIERVSGDALKTIFLETDVGRWIVHSQCVHEIALVGEEDLILELLECDASVPLFCEIVEKTMRQWGKFSSFAQVDSSESHSESDEESEGAPLAAIAAAEEMDTWDCTYCEQANQGENQVQCGECGCIRDDVWKCHCNRVHSVQVNSCICGRWRCVNCTFINERSSLGNCSVCGYNRGPMDI